VRVPREDFRTKAVRYLGEARLQVRLIDGAEVRATCRGDSGQAYSLGFGRGAMSATAPDLEQLRSYGAGLADTVADVGGQLAFSVDPDWNEAAWRALVRLARSGAPFSADDLVAEVGPAESPGASGALFRAAARSGLIECVGYGVSRRLSRHGGLMRRWQGLKA
jgi:hypothetical protein